MDIPLSLGTLLRQGAERIPDNDAVRFRVAGKLRRRSWKQLVSRSESLAQSLRELGLEKGGRVGIIGTPSYEYLVVLGAVWLADGVACPVHHTCTEDEIDKILQVLKPEILVISGPSQLKKLLRINALDIPVLLMQEDEILDSTVDRGLSYLRLADLPREQRPSEVYLLANLLGEEKSLPRRCLEPGLTPVWPTWAGGNDPAVIIHTPDAEGNYLGVILSHRALVYQAEQLAILLELTPADLHLMVLPLSHVQGLTALLASLRAGSVTAFGGGFRSLIEDLRFFNPTFVVGVPRMYEKLVSKIKAASEELGLVGRTIFKIGIEARKDKLERAVSRESRDFLSAVEGFLADKVVFPGIKAVFGGRIRFFVSGGAPLSRDCASYISALGVPLFEGYGLTETGGASHLNHSGAGKIGTVGQALPHVEVKLGEEGEILVKTPSVMSGFASASPQTTTWVDEEGWLHTGDIGTVDPDGFLWVSGRKKDLIVTATGKNVAPQKIEALLKTIPMVNRAVVFGDGLSHLIALITLDEEVCLQWAQRNGVPAADLVELARSLELYAEMEQQVEKVNRSLAPPERVRRFAIIDRQFLPEMGEISSMDKIRRSQVQHSFAAVIRNLLRED